MQSIEAESVRVARRKGDGGQPLMFPEGSSTDVALSESRQFSLAAKWAPLASGAIGWNAGC